MKQTLVLTAALVLFCLAAAAPAAAEVIQIEVKNLNFTPAKITAHVGDTLQWNNDDFVLHSATTSDKSWDINLPAHGKGSVKLDKPGTISYFCRLHPNMKGEVDVKP